MPDDAVTVPPPKKGGKREKKIDKGRPPVRFVTAASLFDGHDAAIN
ncbi:MAG: hypothetical protein IIC56_11325, partial [Proteobacteria bacterium]|nr:hypothetical protein [Pseudomonadota bacterium]